MIKKCLWKGQRLNCSSIFKMHPTDRGMCCAFNKERADEMFKVSRYEEQIMYLTEQDKNKSHENADVPSWWVLTIHPHIFAIKEFLNCRYDPVPEAGKSKGLTLVLDAHSDLVTSSSIPDYFQAIIFLCSLYNISEIYHLDFRDLRQSLIQRKIIQWLRGRPWWFDLVILYGSHYFVFNLSF